MNWDNYVKMDSRLSNAIEAATTALDTAERTDCGHDYAHTEQIRQAVSMLEQARRNLGNALDE